MPTISTSPRLVVTPTQKKERTPLRGEGHEPELVVVPDNEAHDVVVVVVVVVVVAVAVAVDDHARAQARDPCQLLAARRPKLTVPDTHLR